jgi:hypothetical protein
MRKGYALLRLGKFGKFYLSLLIAGAILAVLFLLPSTAGGVGVTLTGDARGSTDTTATLTATVQLDPDEFVDEVKLDLSGPGAVDFTGVSLPLSPGNNQLVPLPAGKGVLYVDVQFSNVSYGYGYTYGEYGWGQKAPASGTGSITYTLRYRPPAAGAYDFHLVALANGMSVACDVTALDVMAPSATPTPTRVPPEDQVIIPPSWGGGAGTFEPGQSMQVTNPDQSMTLDISGGFTDEPVQVVMDELSPTQAPEPPPGKKILRALSINVYDMLGNHTSFVAGVPVSLRVAYTDEDLASVGGDPSKLVIMRYVPDRGWITLSTTVDPVNKVLIAQLTTFSTFALGAEATVGDINGDSVVDYLDLATFAAGYGTAQGDAAYKRSADLNSDGYVNHLDLAILASNYSPRR